MARVIRSMAEILNLRPKNKMIRRVEIESAKQFIWKYVEFAISIIYENDIVTVRLWARGLNSTFNYSIHDYAKNAILARGLNELINRGELINQHVIYTHDDNGNLWFYTIQLLRFRLYDAPLYATRVIENIHDGDRLIYGKALFFVDIFRTPYGQDISEINEKINEFLSRLNA